MLEQQEESIDLADIFRDISTGSQKFDRSKATLLPQDNATDGFASVADIAMAIPRGIVGAAKSVYNLADMVSMDVLPNWDNNPLGQSTTTVGGFVEVMSQFLTGFIPGAGAISWLAKGTGAVAKGAQWMKGPSLAQSLARGGAAGAVADFAVFEGDEMRLSNLVEALPGLSNPITEYLSAKEDDVDSLEGRLKNVIEGGVVGAVAETAIRAIIKGVSKSAQVVKAVRKAVEEGKSPEQVAKIRDRLVEEAAPDIEAAARELDQVAWQGPPSRDEYIQRERSRIVSQMSDEELVFARRGEVPFQPGEDVTKGVKVRSLDQGNQGTVVEDLGETVRVKFRNERTGRSETIEVRKDQVARTDGRKLTREEVADLPAWHPLRESIDAEARASRKRVVSRTEDLGQLTRKELDQISEEIPRNPDGTIDTIKFRDFLKDLRDNRRINLLPMLDSMGPAPTVTALDAVIKGGGIPARPATKSNIQSVLDAQDQVRELAKLTPAQLEKIATESADTLQAVDIVLRQRIVETAQANRRLVDEGTPSQAKEAAEALLEQFVAVARLTGTQEGRLLQARNTAGWEAAINSVAGNPNEARVIAEILSELIDSPRLGDAVAPRMTVTATGIDIAVELFKNSALSGPRTTSVNGFGNLFGMYVNQGERVLGAKVAKILGRKRATDLDVLASQEAEVLFGFVDNLMDFLFSASSGSRESFKKSWRREGSPVTMTDSAWREGQSQQSRAISSRRLGLVRPLEDATGAPVLDDLGREMTTPTPFGAMVDFIGKIVNLPYRLMGATDEGFSYDIARTNARMMVRRNIPPEKLAAMSAKEIDTYIERGVNELFIEGERLYSRRAMNELAAKQAVSEGYRPGDAMFNKRVSDLVNKGDESIGFERFDLTKSRLARVIEGRVRDATWKRQLDDLMNDPLRGAGTRTIAGIGIAAQKLVEQVPFTGLVLPFIRTPVNLIAWALNRNPASLVWKGIRKDWYQGNAEMQAELMGKLTTGVALYTAGVSLAAGGFITGRGPRDPAMQRQLRESGWQPYAMKIGDTYVSFARADPASTVIGMIADAVDAINNTYQSQDAQANITDATAAAIGVLTNMITQKTFLAGLTGTLNAIVRPDIYGTQLVRSYAANIIPNFMAQATTPFEDDLYKARSALDAIMVRIPGWGSDSVDKLRNPLGEPLTKMQGPLNNATDVVNPFTISYENDDPINRELTRLGKAVGPPRRVLDGDIDLWDFRNSSGQTAYDRFQELTSTTRIQGRSLRASLLRLMQTPGYRRLPETALDGSVESPRVTMLQSELSRYRREAFTRLLDEFPDLRARHSEVSRAKSRGR